MMKLTGEFIRGVLVTVFLVGVAGWLVVLTVRRAEDPARMIFKWVLTAGMCFVLFGVVGKIVGAGGYGGAFIGIPAAAACGLVFAIIWRHQIAGLISKPFTSLYDGGSEPPDPHPAYSIAQSRQKQGRYLEAVAEVQKQLNRFPTDVEGHLLLAQIQAEDLKDLPAAEQTIQRLCEQPDHAPKNLVFALYSMADWHLAVTKDLDGARRSLQQIIALFPESEFALGAAQRIAHLNDPEMMLDPHVRKHFFVSEGPKNLGLLRSQVHLLPEETDPKEAAAQYVKHLEQYPLDTEAREKLAIIYADHYQRLDLATDQLEQMIAQPNQPARLVVHWLNLLADLQIRSGAEFETVKATLERIVARDPKLAAAEIARNRLARLRLEVKAKSPKQQVKLGTYEQNIGLKRDRPTGTPPLSPKAEKG